MMLRYNVWILFRLKSSSVKVNVDDKVFPNAVILPNKVILGVVAQLDAVIRSDFKVIGAIVA